ncbi:hypothetical protein T484DRAFT_2909124 [Baffinella frigidus]|nr:hypothetical protein T484DRAFT_2909124 [Cryptophyta sp. CCMP2293]
MYTMRRYGGGEVARWHTTEVRSSPGAPPERVETFVNANTRYAFHHPPPPEARNSQRETPNAAPQALPHQPSSRAQLASLEVPSLVLNPTPCTPRNPKP